MPFTPDRLARVAELERWHFWFVARRLLIQQLLDCYARDRSQIVVDIGCGTGYMTSALIERGFTAVGIDSLAEGFRMTRLTQPEVMLVQGDAMFLPLRQNSIDAALLLDVLEHVDDMALLMEMYQKIRPQGLLLVTVPAIPWLWSYRDEAAGHLRRYTSKSLQKTLADSQFHILDIRYYQVLTLPVLSVMRVFGRSGPALRDIEESPGLFVNKILTSLSNLEIQVGNWIRLPIGSSLIAVCERS